MLRFYQEPILQQINDPLLDQKGVTLFIKREDLIHPFVSGNKWRKLKYNLIEAKDKGVNTLLTFGGAYSNHIYATAAAANESGLKSIGVIRGEELACKPLNKTLRFAQEQGMNLKFVSREKYRQKASSSFLDELEKEFGGFYLLPEGGTNELAIKGCEEIVDNEIKAFDVICTCVGTGGTISGIITAVHPAQKVIGFSALKGDFLTKEVEVLLANYTDTEHENWTINNQYHFGGYAKTPSELITFIRDFETKHQIPLDQIYTGKMMFGLFELIAQSYFEQGTKILAIHTGGLQGRSGSSP